MKKNMNENFEITVDEMTEIFGDTPVEMSFREVKEGMDLSLIHIWDSSIYQLIRGLSENVIVPIAGIIITFVLCYELIAMITEKNNLHDMDTWMFFKWFFKAAVAIYLVTNTFDIVMAVFRCV